MIETMDMARLARLSDGLVLTRLGVVVPTAPLALTGTASSVPPGAPVTGVAPSR